MLGPFGTVLLLAICHILLADRFLHNALNTTVMNNARDNAEAWAQKFSRGYPELFQEGHDLPLGEELLIDIMQSAALNDVFLFKLFDPSGDLVFVSDGPIFSSESTETGVVDVVVDVSRSGKTVTSLQNGEDTPNRPDVRAEYYVKALPLDGTAYGVFGVYVDASDLSISVHNVFHAIGRILILGSVITYLLHALFFVARRKKSANRAGKFYI